MVYKVVWKLCNLVYIGNTKKTQKRELNNFYKMQLKRYIPINPQIILRPILLKNVNQNNPQQCHEITKFNFSLW